VGVPDVDTIDGLPPAVALQQQRGTASSRSTVGSVTTLSNLLRVLYSRAGSYPRGQPMLYSEDFSPNTPQGACPTCHGARYNPDTLKISYRGKNIADVLRQTVDEAYEFFRDERGLQRSLQFLHDIGLGYLRLGQPATELSGGEAQRIKLATELQRAPRGATLYVIDEPTIGLHPADVDRLMVQLDALVEAGNTVVVAEHEMRVAAAADWIIDMGPGAGDRGGRVVASGTPTEIARCPASRTAPYLAPLLPAAPAGRDATSATGVRH
jgi:excinuclease ABC subunit A